MSALLRSHAAAMLLRGTPLPLLGRLLADTTRAGEVVALDPATGGEVAKDERPAFVLSDETEATDGNIVRQAWDLSRAVTGSASAMDGRPGVPVVWSHKAELRNLGQWEDLRVVPLGAGPALVGRANLNPRNPVAMDARQDIRDGYLRAVSVRWIPGEMIRRSELDPKDPLWRAAEEDWCGMPGEGYVMGTEAKPNGLVEASFVTTPAQANAVVTERLHQGAERAAGEILAGRDPSPGDMQRLLAIVARDPGAVTFMRRLVREELALERAARSTPANLPTPAAAQAPDFFRRFGGT